MQQIEFNAAVRAEIEKVVEVSAYLWQREWAERNGGNISVDLTDIFGPAPADLSQYPHCPLSMVGGRRLPGRQRRSCLLRQGHGGTHSRAAQPGARRLHPADR